MAIERARYFPEISREEMSAEALALAFDANVNLSKRAVIEAIAATMDSLGDPLERIWLEDANGRGRTYKVDRALAVLGSEADFRCLWAIPESERRSRKPRWLRAAIIDNMAVSGATLFFAIPRGLTKEFVPHITLLKSLAQIDIVPQYGFGYMREYGPPDDFAVGYAYEHGTRAIDLADRGRQSAFDARAGNQVERADPYRHALRLIPDVFPLNILSDTLMRRKLGDASFEEWILQNTGFASLMRIGPRCFAWSVPSSRAAAVSAQLNEFGLIVATGRRRAH